MLARRILSAVLLAFLSTSPVTARAAETDGIVHIKSAYSMPETIKRLKKDVADEGIMFFDGTRFGVDGRVEQGTDLAQKIGPARGRHLCPGMKEKTS